MNIFDDGKYKEYLKGKKDGILYDMRGLGSAADKFNHDYVSEIESGTLKKRLLLEDGVRKGIAPDKIEYGALYIPTRETPILNFLYFMLRDDPDKSRPLLECLREDKDLGEDVKVLLEQHNKETGHMWHKDFESTQPNQGTFLYGDVTLEIFDKIKKLKALSKSPNEREAFSAFRKCNELCKKHGLEFDKIRCDVS